MATLLNRGISLPTDTEIRLNNKLFETEAGTILLTIRPDTPGVTPSVNSSQTLLSGGFVDLLMIQNSGQGGGELTYSIQLKSKFGTGGTLTTSTLNNLNYGQEITIGGTYDKSTGILTLYSSVGTSADSGQQNLNAFTGNLTAANAEFSADTSTDIGISGFDGYFGKLATYSSAFSSVDMESLVQNPATWPTSGTLGGSLVHFLDASSLVDASQVNTTRPESHTLSFGTATANGYLYIDGVGVYLRQGMSGSDVAQEVHKVLSQHSTYTLNVEKQEILFHLDAGQTSTTDFKIADVAIPASTSIGQLLDNAKSKLEEKDSNFIKEDPNTRVIVDYGTASGSLIVTFTGTDLDVDPLTIESPASSKAAATVRTIQDYSSVGQGRDIKFSGNTVTIKVQAADGTIPGGLTYNGTDPGVSVTYIGGAPSTAAIPSLFTLNRDPVSEVQRISITEVGSAAGTLTVSNSFGSSLGIYNISLNETPGSIAAGLVSQLADSGRTDILSTSVDGDSVLVTFDPSEDEKLMQASSTVTKAVITQVTELGENTRGESQTIVFGDNGATAGTITVDGVNISVAAGAKGSTIATNVRDALIQHLTQVTRYLKYRPSSSREVPTQMEVPLTSQVS